MQTTGRPSPEVVVKGSFGLFSFDATPAMFVALLVLFGWCTIWSAYELTRPQSRRQRIANTLHLAMSAVMLLMVAGPTWSMLTSILPTPALAVLFGLATTWFGWLAIDVRADGRALLHFLGHAAMFAAMAWHLAAMAAMTAGMTAGDGGGSGHGHSGHGHTDQMGAGGGMGDWMTVQSGPGGVLWWFALMGLPLMAYLLVASLRALWQAARPAAVAPTDPDCAQDDHAAHHPAYSCHEVRPPGSVKYRLAALSDFAMTGGMFAMSTGLLAPLLPFLGG